MRVSGRRIGRCALLACALASAACGRVGSENEPNNANGARGGTQSGGNSGVGGGVSNGGATANAGSGGSSAASGGTLGLAGPRPSQVRRLSAVEYQATVTDMLGTTTQVVLNGSDAAEDGFDNVASVSGVSDVLLRSYLEAAETLTNEVFSTEALRLKIETCTQADDMTCVRNIITQTGLHLFRRPVLEEEIASYQKVYTRARARAVTHEGALKDVLVALLVSAQFVYRMEFVPPAAGIQPLTSYEVATRLSYLLWSSAPDDELLNAAQQNTLQTEPALAAEVTRLLADPKAARFSLNFMGQWLGTRMVPYVHFNPGTFPEWTPSVGAAAATEMYAYFAELLEPDKPFSALLDSRAHFVNPELGALYGLTIQGPVTQRVELTGVDRQGFLGLVGFLALSAPPLSRAEPSERGAWILNRLLCSPLPAIPSNMPGYDLSVLGESGIRGYLEGLNAQPQCGGCHAQSDPPGLALENYDGIGRYRMAYPNGSTIDPSVTLSAQLKLPGDTHVTGIAGLSSALATAPQFTACAAQRLYGYGLGRAFSEEERANVQALTAQWQGGPMTLRNLMLSLVKSAAFRSRSDGGDL